MEGSSGKIILHGWANRLKSREVEKVCDPSSAGDRSRGGSSLPAGKTAGCQPRATGALAGRHAAQDDPNRNRHHEAKPAVNLPRRHGHIAPDLDSDQCRGHHTDEREAQDGSQDVAAQNQNERHNDRPNPGWPADSHSACRRCQAHPFPRGTAIARHPCMSDFAQPNAVREQQRRLIAARIRR